MKQKMSRFGWCALFLIMACGAVAAAETKKKRVFIVSSYNKAYIWSQSTQKGVSAAIKQSTVNTFANGRTRRMPTA